MPIVAEQEAALKGKRQWIWPPIGLLVLMLIIGGSLKRGVSFTVGGRVPMINLHIRGSGGFRTFIDRHVQGPPRPGQHYVTTGGDEVTYWIEGEHHYLWIGLAGQVCEIAWFKGRRAP